MAVSILPIDAWRLILTFAALALAIGIIMGFSSKNHFSVAGKTVLITGGSQGMGLAVAELLSSKGTSVIIVARSPGPLATALESIRAAASSSSKTASDSTKQRFHSISADLTSASACADVMAQATAWNGGRAPDIVWCCAGSATPTLFIDTEPEELRKQMDSNYFTAAYTAHAAMRAWLRPEDKAAGDASAATTHGQEPGTRHLIFTSSFLAFFAVAGYSPYTPTKNALRGLADSLAMEVQLYSGAASPSAKARAPYPEIKIATVYPATIFSGAHASEQLLKSDLTKKLEEDDGGQTPAQVAAAAVRGLEKGEELVTTAGLTRLVAAGVLGGTRNVGWVDRGLSWVMGGLGVLGWVRWDLDGKTYKWGKEHGGSGMKRT